MSVLPKLSAIIMTILMTGCVATNWVKVDDTNANYVGDRYSVALPAAWMRMKKDESLILSKDGVLLQAISIHYKPHDNAFEKLEKSSSPNMLPSELAELTIAELKAAQEGGLPSLEVVSNEPIEISGHQAFAVHLIYTTSGGLQMEILIQGFADGKGLYLIKYTAPSLYYFDRDRPVFDGIVQSFRKT